MIKLSKYGFTFFSLCIDLKLFIDYAYGLILPVSVSQYTCRGILRKCKTTHEGVQHHTWRDVKQHKVSLAFVGVKTRTLKMCPFINILNRVN